MKHTADNDFFSFRMLLTVFCWIVGTILMVLSVYIDVDIFWGLALVITGIILLVIDVISK
jgi:hypothetical protein